MITLMLLQIFKQVCFFLWRLKNEPKAELKGRRRKKKKKRCILLSFTIIIVTDRVKSFYRALNSILRIDGRSSDMILLQLIESHCVPILSYAVEVVEIANRDEKRSMRVAYNSIFRKLFGYRIFESVTNLQHSLHRPTWEELVEKRRSGFHSRVRACSDDELIKVFC